MSIVNKLHLVFALEERLSEEAREDVMPHLSAFIQATEMIVGINDVSVIRSHNEYFYKILSVLCLHATHQPSFRFYDGIFEYVVERKEQVSISRHTCSEIDRDELISLSIQGPKAYEAMATSIVETMLKGGE
jgi:hypothetical protein